MAKTKKTIEELLAEASIDECENWVRSELWPDYYVSDYGQVFSIKTKAVMQTNLNSSGYTRVHLTDSATGRDKQELLHRLVATHFIPNPAQKPCVDHIDSNRTNARRDNLRWCTYSENMKWAVENRKRRKAEIKAARLAVMDDLIESMQESKLKLNMSLKVAKKLQEDLA